MVAWLERDWSSSCNKAGKTKVKARIRIKANRDRVKIRVKVIGIKANRDRVKIKVAVMAQDNPMPMQLPVLIMSKVRAIVTKVTIPAQPITNPLHKHKVRIKAKDKDRERVKDRAKARDLLFTASMERFVNLRQILPNK